VSTPESTRTTDKRRTDVDKAFMGHATYRSLGEQRLSEAEERFEKGRRTVGLVLAPLAALVIYLIPFDIPAEQHLLAAVLVGVIVVGLG
jgi:sodium-dependent dicarboxylate transporter 2/3/5